MGSGESKKTDNVVADTVDFSTNMSIDFAVSRLHGGTFALHSASDKGVRRTISFHSCFPYVSYHFGNLRA